MAASVGVADINVFIHFVSSARRAPVRSAVEAFPTVEPGRLPGLNRGESREQHRSASGHSDDQVTRPSRYGMALIIFSTLLSDLAVRKSRARCPRTRRQFWYQS